MTHADTAQLLTSHGIDIRITDDHLEALEEWTENGVPHDEWITVTCTTAWLRDFLNY